MIAANRAGARLLESWVAEQGIAPIAATMRQLQIAAAGKVRREIARLPDGEHRFADRMDDGTPVAVRLVVAGDRMAIDFAGTGAAVPGNLNAPRAVVQAAVIYVLRSLVAERIPLNGGCLEPVDDRDPARLAARSAARVRGGRRQRRDLAARGGRAARRDRPRRREPGHDEQRRVRRRDVRLLRDDRRRRGRGRRTSTARRACTRT